MSTIIKLRLYRLFWETVAVISPRRGLAWLSNKDLDSWGREDAIEILELISNSTLKGNLKSIVLLDYGCGMGRVAKHLAPYVGKIICADISRAYLKVAKSYLQEYTNIEYLHVNGKDLHNITNESIDVVYSIGVFVHINRKDAPKLFREIKRVLKERGIFIVDLPKPGISWPSYEQYEHHDIETLTSIFDEVIRTKEEGHVVRMYLRKS